MTSMTGFGHGEYRDERVQIVIELRSYNNRFLEPFINLPYSLKQLEPRLREYLSARIQRGKVELYVSVTELEDDSEVVVDAARARSYAKALNELRRVAGIRERPRLAHFIGLDGVLRTTNKRDPETLWETVAPALDKVFAEFNTSRVTEGKKTEEDIRRCSADIRARLAVVESMIPAMEERIKTTLRDRFKELLADGVDETRILAETAVQLMRSDINEEIQRMKAHLESLDEALGREGPQGKRLDFVCQELGREINTIGSKTGMLEIDQAVIAVKDSLEKIREQLRNVE